MNTLIRKIRNSTLTNILGDFFWGILLLSFSYQILTRWIDTGNIFPEHSYQLFFALLGPFYLLSLLLKGTNSNAVAIIVEWLAKVFLLLGTILILRDFWNAFAAPTFDDMLLKLAFLTPFWALPLYLFFRYKILTDEVIQKVRFRSGSLNLWIGAKIKKLRGKDSTYDYELFK